MHAFVKICGIIGGRCMVVGWAVIDRYFEVFI